VQFEPGLYPWISVAALAWGLLDCFFGYKIFKFTIALLGAVTGGLLCQAGAAAAGLGGNGGLAAVLGGALLGAGLAFLFYLAAVFFAGFGFGATLAVLLLSHFNHLVALFAAIVAGLVGGFAALKLQKLLLALATALLGSFRAVLAVAYFTSQLDWLYYFRQPDQIPALIDNHPWMLPAILLLATVGAIAQLEPGGGKKKTKEKDE